MDLRRQRILHEARRLLNEVGLEHFSVRELGRRAEVSTKTLYNAFGNRDVLIGKAIRQVYDEVHGSMVFRTADRTLPGLLDRGFVINKGNLKSRNYAKAVAEIYFSPSASSELRSILQDMAIGNTHLWLSDLRKNDQIESWVNIDSVTRHISNAEYGLILDWSCGRVPDLRYLEEFARLFLTIAISITKDEKKSEAISLMYKLEEFGVDSLYFNPRISVPARIKSLPTE